MSKKKNTLKDLDEFLKQQAATLVTPSPLSDKVEATLPAPPSPTEKTAKPAASVSSAQVQQDLSLDKILEDLETLATKEGTTFRKKIYDLVLQAADSGPQSQPEDKMLINTILYLTNTNRWQDAIRDYWRNKQ